MVGKRESIELDRLSQRERSIVELAIEGHTDAQIAQQLQITPNTVNSYWVRIRGKIGHVSRTELVATILRQQAALQLGEAQESLITLQYQLNHVSADHPRLLASTLNSLPDPIFTVSENCLIQFANEATGELVGLDPECLLNRPAASLVVAEDAIRFSEAIGEVSSGEHPTQPSPVLPFRARRVEGSPRQVMVQFHRSRREGERWVTGIIRTYEDSIRLL